MKALNPSDIHPPFAAYSHAIRAGEHLVTSGQLGISAEGRIPDGAEAQARLIFDAIDAILRDSGMGRCDVLRLNAYVSAREHMAGYMRARDGWAEGLEPRPASTLMIVTGFSRPEFVVEIEALAWRRNS